MKTTGTIEILGRNIYQPDVSLIELRRSVGMIVTHNMAQTRRASDDCIFMLLGEIIEKARTTDLFVNPRDERTAAYIEGRYA